MVCFLLLLKNASNKPRFSIHKNNNYNKLTYEAKILFVYVLSILLKHHSL